jgi:pimeloyl-ACP methyl ester carboxylesterase
MIENEVVEVDGCTIAWRARGDRNRPAILLVHGAGAHSRWWDCTLEHLPADRRVVTIDLSGHGLSGTRDHYDSSVWTRELETVITASTRGTAAVVGHSSGGRLAVVAASRARSPIEALLLMDSPTRRPSPRPEPTFRRRAARRVYRSRAEAIAAFRLLPAQPTANQEVLDELAANSIVEATGGWSFASEPSILGGALTDVEVATALHSVTCPVTIVRGELTPLVDGDVIAFIRETLGYWVPAIDIPGAYHHPMLDEPVATALAIETLLDDPPIGAAHERRVDEYR